MFLTYENVAKHTQIYQPNARSIIGFAHESTLWEGLNLTYLGLASMQLTCITLYSVFASLTEL